MNFLVLLFSSVFLLLINGLFICFVRPEKKILHYIYFISWLVSAVLLGLSYYSFNYQSSTSTNYPQISFINSDLSFIFYKFYYLVFICVFILSMVTAVYTYFYSKKSMRLNLYLASLQFSVCSLFLILFSKNILCLFLGWSSTSILAYIFSVSLGGKNNKVYGASSFLRQNFSADLCISSGIAIFAFSQKSLNLSMIFEETFWINYAKFQKGVQFSFLGLFQNIENSSLLIFFAGWLVFFGVIIKSAQFPFYNGIFKAAAYSSIPVHAVLHRVIIANSGLFLLLRMNNFYSVFDVYNLGFMFFGVLSIVFSRWYSICKNNVYQIVLFSTSGSMGFILLLYSLNFHNLVCTSLLMHMFFKVCFVLAVSVIVQIMSGEQDISKMGGIRKQAKITFTVTFIIALILSFGWFILDGYVYSNALDVMINGGGFVVVFFYCLFFILNCFYLMRFLVLVFEGENRADEHVKAHVEELSIYKLFPLLILVIIGMFMVLGLLNGYITVPLENIISEIKEKSYLQEIKIIKRVIWWGMISIVILFFSLVQYYPKTLLKLDGGKAKDLEKNILFSDISYFCAPIVRSIENFFEVKVNKAVNVIVEKFYKNKAIISKKIFYLVERFFPMRFITSILIVSSILSLVFILLFTYKIWGHSVLFTR